MPDAREPGRVTVETARPLTEWNQDMEAAGLRAVVETMLDAHIIVSRQGLICSFNPAAEEMFGWLSSEVVGLSSSVLLRTGALRNDGSWKRYRDQTEVQAATRQRWIHDDGGLRRDGSCFPIEVTVSPFQVAGQLYYSCTVRDLTERWAAETHMSRLAAAVEHAGDAIAILSPDSTILYVNPQYERLTGFTRNEVVGRPLARGASEDSVYEEIWATVFRGDVWSGQVRSRRRDGSVFDEELTITPVFDGQGRITSLVAVMRDVTRRLEAELECRRLAEALQHCHDAIEILDLQGRIVYVNPAYEARSGQRLADIRGSRPEALADFGPGVENYEDMMQTVYRGGRAWSGILKLHDIDGELQEEYVTVSPIRDTRGQVTGYVVVKRPVTPDAKQQAGQAPARAIA
jgi:PAS domain S-box-containing protein